MNYKIFGMPYNYTDITDPGGRVFARTMFSDMSVLTITPGSPDMAGVILSTIKGVINFSGLGEFDERKFKFQPEWTEYKGYVNAMSQLLFNKMMSHEYGGDFEKKTIVDFLSDKGISTVGVDSSTGTIARRAYDAISKKKKSEVSLDKYNKALIEKSIAAVAADERVFISKLHNLSATAGLSGKEITTLADIKNLSPWEKSLFGDGIGKDLNNEMLSIQAAYVRIDEDKKKFAKEYTNILAAKQQKWNSLSDSGQVAVANQLRQRKRKDALKSSEGVMFYMEASSSVSETISSSYSQSSNAGEMNSKAAEKRDAAVSRSNMSWWRSSASSMTEWMGGMATHLGGAFGVDTTAINSGESIVYPMKWDSSSHRKSYNISMRFTSPYGDSYSVFDNIMFPLILLMAFTLPKQGKQINSYTAPFIVRAEAPGNFLSDMGIVESISWRKGTTQGDWTANGLPLSMEVTLVITDLYPVMSMSDSAADLNRNGSISYYLANMAGITAEQNDTISLAVTEKYNRIKTSIKAITSFDNVGQSFVDQLVDVVNWVAG